MPRYFYMNPDAVAVELSDRIWSPLEWHSMALEADAVQSEWLVEDPYSDLLLYHWRRVYVVEDAAPVGFTVIGMGFIQQVVIERSEVFVGLPTARAWRLTITDLNYLLSYPLFDSGDSPDRATETDLERIAWYLTTQEALHVEDNLDYIDTTDGVDVDARDLLTQSPQEMLRGVMDQSGRNAFVRYDEAVGPPDFDQSEGELALWYAHPDSDLWPGDAFLSNDLADRATAMMLLSEEMELELNGGRIAWKIHVAYDGGLVSVHDDTIADTYTAREKVVDAHDLNDATTATARGNRMLQDGRDPEGTMRWGYHGGPDVVNAIYAGQTFQYRATHLGGLELLGQPDYTQPGGVRMRAIDRTVREVAPSEYDVFGSAISLAPLPTPCDDATASAEWEPENTEETTNGHVFYLRSGISAPTIGSPHDGDWHFEVLGTGGSPDIAGFGAGNYVLIGVRGAGTLTIQTAVTGGSSPIPWEVGTGLGGDPLTGVYDSGTVDGGDPLELVMDTAGGTECEHWVYLDLWGNNPAKTGYAGATWVSAE